MKIVATSFKRSPACTTTLSAPNPVAATTNPCLCWWLLDTHRQIWVSLLWGHCCFLLGPGAHKVLFVPSKSLFPQSCVSSRGSMVGLMVISSQRAYVIPRTAAPRASAPCSTADLYLHRRHSNTQRHVWLSLCGVSASWALWPSLASMGFDYKCDFAPHTILLGHLIALGCGVSFFFFGRIQHSLVYGCSATSCNFGVLTGEDEGISFYSAILITSGGHGVICGGYGVWS